MDLCLTFTENCCYVERGLSTPRQELYQAYRDWSKQSSIMVLGRNRFYRRLGRFFKTQGTRPVRTLGLFLKPEEEWDIFSPELARKVYFISDGEKIKIGVSQDPETRRTDLKTGSSRPLQILYTVDAGYGVEARLHSLLEAYRGEGEWFDLTPEQAWRIARGIANHAAEPILCVPGT